MIKELEILSQLSSFNSVMIITRHGDLLYYCNDNQHAVITKNFNMLRYLLKQVTNASYVFFRFEKGVGIVHGNAFGYLFLLLNDGQEKETAIMLLEKLGDLFNSYQFKRDILLSMLEDSHISLKPRITRELAMFADATVAKHLLDIVKNVDIANLSEMTAFLHEVFTVLGLCCGHEGTIVVQDFLKRSREKGKLAMHLERSAQNLCKQMAREKKKYSSSSSAPVARRGGAYTGKQNDKIDILVEAGKLEEAGHLVMEEIRKAASGKQFIKAEKLRQRLIAINPNMLTEIIRAAEIIEEEQMASIPGDFKKTWSMLRTVLADDEFAALYHHLAYKKSKSAEVLASQGSFSSKLFFIQNGNLQIYGNSEGKEIVIRVAGEGEVVGGTFFFESSVWTVNVRSLGGDIYMLSKARFTSLVEMYPGIESKLMDFCATFKKPANVFTRKERTRRKFKRIRLKGRILMSLLDKNEKETGTGVRGDLFDISMGGISFSLNISRKKNAQILFGSRVKVKIPNTDKSNGTTSVKVGRIVAVRGHHIVNNEYSVHVEFDTVLSYPELYVICGQG